MNEDKMRELIKESLLKTSNEFTDKLMNKVAVQSIRKKTRFAFLSALVACFILFFVVYYLASLISFSDFKVNITPKVVWILGSLSVFLILNQLMILRDAFSRLNN